MSDTKRKIMTAAIEVIGAKGFKEAKIAEIAEKAGVGDATIYEYFKNKEDLLLEIPIDFTKDMLKEIDWHMMGINGAFNKLRKFIWWWFHYIETNPGYAAIILLELKTSKKFMRTDGYESAKVFYGIIVDIIKAGKEEGIIKESINTYLARSIIIGTLEHNIIRWLLKERNYSLLSIADELVEMFIDFLKTADSDTRTANQSKQHEKSGE